MTGPRGAIAFPMAFDPVTRGLATTGDLDLYVAEAIRQVVLTRPGERTHRPDFGVGLGSVVFAPWSDASAALVRALVHEGLTRWLADLMEVVDVVVLQRESRVEVEVQYRVRTGGGTARTSMVVGP